MTAANDPVASSPPWATRSARIRATGCSPAVSSTAAATSRKTASSAAPATRTTTCQPTRPTPAAHPRCGPERRRPHIQVEVQVVPGQEDEVGQDREQDERGERQGEQPHLDRAELGDAERLPDGGEEHTPCRRSPTGDGCGGEGH